MNPLNILFGQIANTIQNHASPNTPGPSYDSNPLLGALGGLFSNFANQNGHTFNGFDPNHDYSQYGNVQSSDADPYGDPGAMGNVQSSDADPYGDPGAR